MEAVDTSFRFVVFVYAGGEIIIKYDIIWKRKEISEKCKHLYFFQGSIQLLFSINWANINYAVTQEPFYLQTTSTSKMHYW